MHEALALTRHELVGSEPGMWQTRAIANLQAFRLATRPIHAHH